ncbi:hypothetical protein [Chitinophaga arvensicola]|uniref:Uncharacterized protein n=1 Tax=Chitinophaga arvensicola TaxID=29529 RepID=A0A1I0QWV9_9BACT|nr:hypothetical protein [Chitinophaga arvensicola]SEW31960.1 hypothetical protein SAMN04488122_1820 [Chitinophaga arvensicola]
MEKNMSVNNRPMLTLEKEIISKADTRTIENMKASNSSDTAMMYSSIPTIPTTTGSVFTLGA